MKAEDLKTKTQDELKKLMLDLKKQQFNLRIQLSQAQLEKTSTVRDVRRDIARVQTFLNMKVAPKAAKPAKAAPKAKAAKAKKAAA
jgi:large subunit ribosomal protein L29